MNKIKTLFGFVKLSACMGIAIFAYSLIVIAEKIEERKNHG